MYAIINKRNEFLCKVDRINTWTLNAYKAKLYNTEKEAKKIQSRALSNFLRLHEIWKMYEETGISQPSHYIIQQILEDENNYGDYKNFTLADIPTIVQIQFRCIAIKSSMEECRKRFLKKHLDKFERYCLENIK